MKTQPPSNFRKIIDRLAYSRQTYEVFGAFVRIAACTLACQTREAEYLEEVKRWKSEDLTLFSEAFAALITEMQDKPFEDILGAYYMEYAISTKGQQWNGEYHTPKPICQMMARMTIDFDEFPATGPITVCEPACGAGAMILAVGEVCTPEQRRRLRVTAIDISRCAVDMCFVNTSLWGIPCRVIHGNTLSMEFRAAWDNIHWIMPWLPLCMRTQKQIVPEIPQQGQPPSYEELEHLKRTLNHQGQQVEMSLV